MIDFLVDMPESPRVTGDKVVDLALEAGPRMFGPDLPAHARETIAKSAALGNYRGAVKRMAQAELAEMHREIEFVSRQNREIEFKATDGLGVPEYRIPVSVHFKMEALFGTGCWQDEDFVEDFLKHHPGLRINVTRGTRGQEYGGRPRITRINTDSQRSGPEPSVKSVSSVVSPSL